MFNHDIPIGSKAKQCKALHAALVEHGELATSDIREFLNIFHAAGRVHDLRSAGVKIETNMRWVAASDGKRHRQAVYVLQQGGNHAA
jgi:hypothetical protein